MKTIKTIKTIALTTICLAMLSCSNQPASSGFSDKFEGKVKREVVSIAPKIPGRVMEIRVKEGDTIKAGDTLAVLDIPEIQAKLEQAEGAVLAANAQYQMSLHGATIFERRQIKEKYTAAKEQFEFAQKSFKRIKSLLDDTLIAQQKYDEIYEKYQAAQAQLNAVEAQKNDIENGVRKEKVMMAEGDFKRASGAYDEVKSALPEKYIIAPVDMIIETISLHKGELALAGYTFFSGYATNDIFFRFTVGERNMAQFTKGAKYSVSLPFMQNRILEARLVSIKDVGGYAKKTASYPNYEIGESTYELKFVPVNVQETTNLYSNMTVLIGKEGGK